MSFIIRAAARTLPSAIRDRYREQWLADARDAAEAGLRPSQIALAALAFAATYDRPLPTGAALTPQLEQRRARLAGALALAAALLSVSAFANLSGSGGLTGNSGYDLFLQLVDSLLLLFVVVAIIVAVVIVTRGRSTDPRLRRAVWLLVLASLSPVAHIVIDRFPIIQGEVHFAVGGLAYVGGAVVLTVALAFLWRALTRPDQRERAKAPAIVFSALAVLVVGAVGVAQATIVWASRTPLVWSWQPGIASTFDDDGTVVQWEIVPTQADYEQWFALKEQFETMVGAAFSGFALATLAAVIALVALAMLARLHPRDLAAAAIASLLIGIAAVLSFVEMTPATSLVAPDLLLAIGRILIVAVVLYAVGGVRLARMRHRHDVEGGVELV